MTLFEIEELARYWIDHPPLHLMAAAYLGVGKERRSRVSPNDPMRPTEPGPGRDVEPLLATLGWAFASGDVHAGLSPVVLDIATLRQRSDAAI